MATTMRFDANGDRLPPQPDDIAECDCCGAILPASEATYGMFKIWYDTGDGWDYDPEYGDLCPRCAADPNNNNNDINAFMGKLLAALDERVATGEFKLEHNGVQYQETKL